MTLTGTETGDGNGTRDGNRDAISIDVDLPFW
jgi:hypothetical protein